MSKIINYIKRGVAIVDICCLVILMFLSLVKGVNIDIRVCFNILICFTFSILLLKIGACNCGEEKLIKVKKKIWIYYLLFAGVFLSIVEIYMFYEEIVKGRSGISCAIAAIATYSLFDSVHKYVIRKE